MINFILVIITILFNVTIELENITNIIILKFQEYKEPYNDSKELNISSIIKNHIYTEIEVGQQILVASFNSDEYGFYMTDNDCIDKSNYIIQKSKSFINVTTFEEGKSGYADETLTLYRDIDFKIKQNGFFENMYISKYNNHRQCAIFGLKIKIPESDYDSKLNFIKTYKNNGNILSYKWTLKYIKNEGTLVIGDSPTNYDPSFKNKKYIEYSTNGIIKGSVPSFGIKFDEITINDIKLKVNKQVYFYHEYNAILVNLEIYIKIRQIFFEKYLNQSICKEKWEFGKYGCILCHKNFSDIDKKSFPTIYFKHIELNTIFELDHNDLFTRENDGELYFLIVLEMNNNEIKFGKPFLKKYTFTIDNESSKLSYFVFEEMKKNKKNYALIIILSIISLILLIAVIILLYKLLMKKWKKRANELDDDYDYITKDEEDINTNKAPKIPLTNNLSE